MYQAVASGCFSNRARRIRRTLPWANLTAAFALSTPAMSTRKSALFDQFFSCFERASGPFIHATNVLGKQSFFVPTDGALDAIKQFDSGERQLLHEACDSGAVK